jgi:hypothetical protein
MSIIDPKYRNKYRDGGDWLSQFVDSQVKEPVTKEKVVTAEDGTKTTEVVETKQTRINMDNLFALAEVNSIDVDKYKPDADKPNAPGRLRMTIGNMLRAAAKKRHGLYNVHGEWNEADAEFIGDALKTQNPDGSKVVVEKPEAEPAEA